MRILDISTVAFLQLKLLRKTNKILRCDDFDFKESITICSALT